MFGGSRFYCILKAVPEFLSHQQLQQLKPDSDGRDNVHC